MILIGVSNPAVRTNNRSLLEPGHICHSTAIVCVESDRVIYLVVDAFDDVDLSAVGPAGPVGPNCRPSRAALGHMGEVEKEQTSSVGLLRGDAYTHSPWRFCNVGVVGIDEYRVRGYIQQTIGPCSGLIHVVNVPSGGITPSKKVEVIEETLPGELIYEFVRLGERGDHQHH